MESSGIESLLKLNADNFHQVVPFDKSDKLLLMDFMAVNTELTDEILLETNLFIRYINNKLQAAGARYGIGGYNEHRTIYSRSHVFDAAHHDLREGKAIGAQSSLMQDANRNEGSLSSPLGGQGAEPRRLHLGIDIWGKPYTKVMAPLDAIVHSFAFNNAYGDYGATIILTHNLDGFTFYTLYGHLSLNSIKNIQEGDVIRKGDVFCEFGIPFENGQWPPHLHFQIIKDMQGVKGDYPGVCRFSERENYLVNCPDPDLILGMMQYAAKS